MSEPDQTMNAMWLAIELKLGQAPDKAWEYVRDLAADETIGYEFYEALIAAGYQELWTLAEMPIPWQNVMRDQVPDMGYGRWCATEPVRRAAALGHTVEDDPPFMSAGSRWTCSACGCAVLKYSDNIYGSAVRSVCEPLAGHLIT